MNNTRRIRQFLLLACVLISLVVVAPATAQTRIAECDACGYCDKREPPENWSQCVQCLYPSIYTPYLDPTLNQTLEILTDPNDPRQPDPSKPIINQPIPPARGAYFTQLGCIDTSLSSFQDPSAAGGVLNFVLNSLIFPAAGALAFLSLIYAAFLLLTAQGDQFQIQKGKRFLTGAIVGLIFTFSSVFLVNTIGYRILRIPGFNTSGVLAQLQRVQTAIQELESDTGELPNHLNPAVCIHNPEIDLNNPAAGIIDTDGSFTGWKGPYLDLADVTDPEGGIFYFDPDYRCRPDVAGCEGVSYSTPNSYDYISGGLSKTVRALVYRGPDGTTNYCNTIHQNICKEPGAHFNKPCTPINASDCRDAANTRFLCNDIQRNPVPCPRTDRDNVVLVLCE